MLTFSSPLTQLLYETMCLVAKERRWLFKKSNFSRQHRHWPSLVWLERSLF